MNVQNMYIARRTYKKRLIILLVLVASLCLLVGCVNDGGSDELVREERIYAKDLVFGYNVDRQDLDDWFKNNGKKVNENSDEYYITNNLATIFYTPSTNNFIVSREIQSRSSTAGISYTYIWRTGFTINLYECFSKAKWVGEYEHIAIDQYMNVANYTAEFKFNISHFASTNKLASIEDNSFSANITFATDYYLATRYFDKNKEGETIYAQYQPCFDAVTQIFKEINSANAMATKYEQTDYANINFSNVQFEDQTLLFTDEAQSIYISGIPNNVLVTYDGNMQTEPGTYTVTAYLTDPRSHVLFSISVQMIISDEFTITI